MSYESNTESDEALARRLQFEEQSILLHTNVRHVGRNPQQEMQDMELARHYAQMDLNPTGSRLPPPPSSQSRGGENFPRIPHRTVSMESMVVGHAQYGLSPRRYGGENFDLSSPRRRGPAGLSSSMSSGRANTDSMAVGHTASRISPRRYEQNFDWSTGSPRRATISKSIMSGTANPFDYSGAAYSTDTAERIPPHASMERRSSRSQSPTRHPDPRTSREYRSFSSDLSGSRTGPQRSSSFDMDHEFLVRSGAYQAAAMRQSDGHRTRRHTDFSASPSKSPAATQLNYAHQMQMRAFSDLQSSRAAGVSHDDDDDLKLAQKMQDLENRGMGRLNSDRELDIEVELESDEGSPGSERRVKSHVAMSPTIQNTLKEDLGRLISESGAKVDELSDEVLRELLGSDGAKQVKLSATETTKTSLTEDLECGATLHPNSPKIKALRAALSGVKIDDLPADMLTADRKDFPPRIPVSSGRMSPLRLAEAPPERRPSKIAEAIPIPNALAELAVSPSKQKKKRRGFLNFGMRSGSRDNLMDLDDIQTIPNLDDRQLVASNASSAATGIPAAIPPPPGGSLSIKPVDTARHVRSVSPATRRPSWAPPGVPSGIPASIPSSNLSVKSTHGIPGGIRPKPAGGAYVNGTFNGSYRGTNMCSACGLTHGTFLMAFDRKFHPECFRCKSCNGKIDPNDQFKYTTDEQGRKHPHHRECFLSFGVKCCICRQTIPATPDGRVPYIKHPFFDNEQMCVRHADEHHRRCSSCQRFEPNNDNSFIDLMDQDRCVCPACCRSVVVDSVDMKPLWRNILSFFDSHLKLQVWPPMRDIPILVIGSESLRTQMESLHHIHASMPHPMTSGLCLTEPNQAGAPFDDVVAILCLTGLPRDLAAGVLAHQAMHAWIKLHPQYDATSPLPPQVEEGLCQLISMLVLSEGLTSVSATNGGGTNDPLDGPSDDKLRQYFKHTIERDQTDLYGGGYRLAAMAYRDIGMEELMAHVLRFHSFPET